MRLSFAIRGQGCAPLRRPPSVRRQDISTPGQSTIGTLLPPQAGRKRPYSSSSAAVARSSFIIHFRCAATATIVRANCLDSSRQLPRYFVMIAIVLSWPPAKGPPPNPVWLCCPCLCQHLPPLRWRSCVTASENATNNPACRKCQLCLKTQGVVPQKQAK